MKVRVFKDASLKNPVFFYPFLMGFIPIIFLGYILYNSPNIYVAIPILLLALSVAWNLFSGIAVFEDKIVKFNLFSKKEIYFKDIKCVVVILEHSDKILSVNEINTVKIGNWKKTYLLRNNDELEIANNFLLDRKKFWFYYRKDAYELIKSRLEAFSSKAL